jgi:hypothetical protein
MVLTEYLSYVIMELIVVWDILYAYVGKGDGDCNGVPHFDLVPVKCQGAL